MIREGKTRSLIVKEGVTIERGDLVGHMQDGQAIPATNTAGLVVLGHAKNTVTGDGAKTIDIESTCAVFTNGVDSQELTQADLNHVCYVVDAKTVGKTATESIIAGSVFAIDADGVWVIV